VNGPRAVSPRLAEPRPGEPCLAEPCLAELRGELASELGLAALLAQVGPDEFERDEKEHDQPHGNKGRAQLP
jgi:hypothetical protein